MIHKKIQKFIRGIHIEAPAYLYTAVVIVHMDTALNN